MPAEDRVIALLKRRYPDFSLDKAPFLPPAEPLPTAPRFIQTDPDNTDPAAYPKMTVAEFQKARDEYKETYRRMTRTEPGKHFSRAYENPGDLPRDAQAGRIRGYGPGAVREEGLGARVVSVGKDMILGWSPRKVAKKEMARLKVEQFPWLTEAERNQKRQDRLDSI